MSSTQPRNYLERQFVFYGAYHADSTNQWIHMFFVPTLVTTGMIIAGQVQFPGAIQQLSDAIPAVAPALDAISAAVPAPVRIEGLTTLLFLVYSLYYLACSIPLGLVMILQFAGYFFVAETVIDMNPEYMGLSTFHLAVIVHIFSWVVQFYGHFVHEGRAPALLDNLSQALLQAPMFVTLEWAFTLGLFRGWKKEVEAMVKVERQKFLKKEARSYDLGSSVTVKDRCKCYDKFSGADCSQRSCPTGAAWTDYPTAGGSAHATATCSNRSGVEKQSITTSVDHADEVQVITLASSCSGGTCDDEVQKLSIYSGSAGVAPAGGAAFYLRFSTSASNCPICYKPGFALSAMSSTTSAISIDAAGASDAARLTTTASSIQTALQTLAHVDTVTVSTNLAATDTWEVVVTFSGNYVGGDVPQLQAIVASGSHTVTPSTTTDGESISGSFTLTYDETTVQVTGATGDTWPDPQAVLGGSGAAASATTAAIAVGATAAEIDSALEALVNIESGGISVAIGYNGGSAAGYTITVTWDGGGRQRGNKPQLSIDSSSLLPPATGSLTCAVATTTDGTFLSGGYRLQWTYDSISGDLDIAWDETASSLASKIMAADDGLGVVAVSREAASPGDNWAGQYTWSVTFRSIPDNLNAATVGNPSTGAGDFLTGTSVGGGANAGVTVADLKQFEQQVLRTSATHVDEVQTIELGGTDTDEVQRLRIYTGFSSYPTGYFKLKFDTTSGCNLCPDARKISATTDDIAIDVTVGSTDAEKATNTAHGIEFAMLTLDNIDAVLVTGVPYSSGTDRGYDFEITFTGDWVGGDVPLVAVDSPGNTPTTWTTSVVALTEGVELGGSVALTFDDTATGNYPTPVEQVGEGLSNLGSSTGGALSVAATSAQIVSYIATLGNLGAVSVTKEAIGGPGMRWVVTFDQGARNRGSRSLLTCASASITPSGTCAVARRQQGSFLSGQFAASLYYEGRTRTTAALNWYDSASTVEAAFQALFETASGIDVAVARSKYEPSGSDDWVGAFDWSITFNNMYTNLPTMTVESGSSFTLSALQAEAGDSGANAALVTSLEKHGSELGEVNEVQLIECSCPATCSGDVKLSFLSEQTAAISHSATAATLRTALSALEGINDVTVNMVGAATLCSASGTTTAVTFTHNPGDVPPLLVDHRDSTAMTLASTGGAVSFYLLADGSLPRGANGFKVKTGTRKLHECSNRGYCNHSTGECQCFVETDLKTAAYGASDNAGGEVAPSAPTSSMKAIYNCGFPLTTINFCPIVEGDNGGQCHSSGTCLSSDGSYRCQCTGTNVTGAACDRKECPSGTALFDEATADSVGHNVATCSNNGKCMHTTGTCLCRAYWNGATDCGESPCPSCGDRGYCLKMSELGAFSIDEQRTPFTGTYTDWDADILRGCACTRFVYGGREANAYGERLEYDCGAVSCPATADPNTSGASARVHERQKLVCAGPPTSGSFTLAFRGNSTRAISYDAYIQERHNVDGATKDSVERALNRLPGIRNVSILVDGGNGDSLSASDRKVCSTTKDIHIVFYGHHEDVPLLTANVANLVPSSTVTITETTVNTHVAEECSGRGTCDYNTGQCSCVAGFGSSDGLFNAGILGDCGHKDIAYVPTSVWNNTRLSDWIKHSYPKAPASDPVLIP